MWAGVDNAWEQEKLEAWKMPENAADRASEPPASIAQPERIGARQSHPSSARSVGLRIWKGYSIKILFLLYIATKQFDLTILVERLVSQNFGRTLNNYVHLMQILH